jgi:hypothetical protein
MDLPSVLCYANHRATAATDTFNLTGVLADIHFHRQNPIGLAGHFRKVLFGYGPNGVQF